MGTYKEVKGDLIAMAIEGHFDVIAHGCNCMCRQRKGLAYLMAQAFGTDEFKLESVEFKGDMNKLGAIDYDVFPIESCKGNPELSDNITTTAVAVVNCYTQYDIRSAENPRPLDYQALQLCLRKLNHVFKGRKIGLPKIGCGLAGGHWDTVKVAIALELRDCDVTIVINDEKEKSVEST